MWRLGLKIAPGVGFALLLLLGSCSRTAPYGLAGRVATKPYLGMPSEADGRIPPLLSQTGVFSDTPRRIASPGLIPYDLNVAFGPMARISRAGSPFPQDRSFFRRRENGASPPARCS